MPKRPLNACDCSVKEICVSVDIVPILGKMVSVFHSQMLSLIDAICYAMCDVFDAIEQLKYLCHTSSVAMLFADAHANSKTFRHPCPIQFHALKKQNLCVYIKLNIHNSLPTFCPFLVLVILRCTDCFD